MRTKKRDMNAKIDIFDRSLHDQAREGGGETGEKIQISSAAGE